MEPIAIHGETIAGRQLTVRRTLIKLTEDLNKHTFDAAELLYEVQENGYYRQWGFQSVGEYAVAELGLKERKSQYLAHVVKVCKECGVKRPDYEPAGISKLRLITSLNPDSSYFNKETRSNESMTDHIVALIAEAPELSTKEIEERVDHLKGMDGDNAMITRSYRVTKSAYNNTVKPALEAMRKLLGSKGRDGTGMAIDYPDGACFEYICREFLNDPRNFMEDEDNDIRTAGTLDNVAESQVTPDAFQGPHKPFEIPTEQ